MTTMDKLQLLSPAGTFDALVAAVSNGADAVYLGSKLFNARRLAGNFTTDDVKKAVQYAHLHNVKIFLTLNTLVKNHEIGPFLNQVCLAAQYGVDALIMQDLTFAPLIKQHFPQMKIHASTQATIMNSPSLQFWQKYVDVFVLAREVTKQQVKEMYAKTHAHLEVFVHGHLCISYSGQCLISSLIGKRSGNRGLCASSCRKQYNGEQYLLSAKDLCMIENISDVIESGAKTVKIEGRMKSPEYVATTTRSYRQQINVYYDKKKIPVTKETMDDLKLAFNREFTPGFFNNEENIVDPLTPSKRGIFLGKVRNGFLTLEDDLELFDGVSSVYGGKREGDFVKKIINTEGEEITAAKKGENIQLLVPGFRNGAQMYVLSQHQGRNLLGEKKLVPFGISLQIKKEVLPKVTVAVQGKTFSFELKIKATEPKKHPLTKDDLDTELRKYQSTIFFMKNITIETDNSFLPKSELTTLRKELDAKILDFFVPMQQGKRQVPLPVYGKKSAQEEGLQKLQKKLHVKVYNLHDVQEALRAGADVIYYDIFADDFAQARDICKGKVPFFAFTPMVLGDEHCSEVKEIVLQTRPDGVLVNNVGLLQLHLPCEIILGYQMNVFNDQQVEFYNHPAVASIELNAQELGSFANKEKLIYYAHGNPVVMTFKEGFDTDALTDKKGYTFRLRKTATGATEMLYSKTIGLLQHTPEILKRGIHQLFLDLEKDVFKTVYTYQQLLQGERVSVHELKHHVTVGNLEKGVM